MRNIPIKQGFSSKDGDIIIFYSGLYKVIDTNYHLIFIANRDGVIYDTMLAPVQAVSFDNNNRLIIEGNEEEVFYKI